MAGSDSRPLTNIPLLLPPVGVWTVSQFQCGGSSSQNPYMIVALVSLYLPTS